MVMISLRPLRLKRLKGAGERNAFHGLQVGRRFKLYCLQTEV
jgi:hypothetical protein